MSENRITAEEKSFKQDLDDLYTCGLKLLVELETEHEKLQRESAKFGKFFETVTEAAKNL